MTPRTLADLRDHGAIVQPHEAVAIAQQLIEPARAGVEAEAAAGPPSPENVVLRPDGSVECGCCATPAVSEIAIFLQSLMPRESLKVPGGLRYALARALLEVEAPPFDSLEELSQALARFERGDRRDVVRRLLARADGAGTGAQLALIEVARLARADGRPMADRRRLPLTTSDLRRELREADRLRYEERAVSTSTCRRSTDAAAPRRTWSIAAAVVVAACAGGGAVELAHHQAASARVSETAAAQSAATPAADRPNLLLAGVSPLPSAAPATDDTSSAQSATAETGGRHRTAAGRPAVRNASVDVSSKPRVRKPLARTHARSRKSEPSAIKQVLTFKWLRDVFK